MKNSGIFLVLVLCAFAFCLVPVSAETIVIQPGSEGKDTYVCDCLPKVNNPNGPATNLYQGQYGKCYDRLLIQWDLSSLPADISITGAVMELKCSGIYGSLSGRMVYYRIVDDWEETGVSFSVLPGHAPEDSVTADWPVSGQWHAVDITGFVRQWMADPSSNRGIYGHSAATTGQCCVQFNSSDVATVANRPKLTVTFTTANGVPCRTDERLFRFQLGQNYPNPFNPVTTIRYSIPEEEFVSLKVFDLRGNEVAVLVDQAQSAGTHEIAFVAKNLASGIYHFRLQAGPLREVKRLILMK
jgi:hypothetical protein